MHKRKNGRRECTLTQRRKEKRDRQARKMTERAREAQILVKGVNTHRKEGGET
mgnify:CR=1 FL=1